MDVFHVGASAPKAPETRGVERDEVRSAARSAQASGSDAFASSADAAAVARYVEKLSTTDDVRHDVLKGITELLGQGVLDTPDAARRAAQSILDS
jgi:hypothetical protein